MGGPMLEMVAAREVSCLIAGAGTGRGRGLWLLCIIGLLLTLGVGCGARMDTPGAPEPTKTVVKTVERTREPAAIATHSPVRPTASAVPSPRLSPTRTARPTATTTPVREVDTMTLTIVYDNYRYAAADLDALRTSWGFACWVETEGMTVLFDTGGDGSTLLHNLSELGLDPLAIDAVVLSHAHADHTGGLGALLGTGVRPTVYVPGSFPRGFKGEVRSLTDLVEVGSSTVIAPGIYHHGLRASRGRGNGAARSAAGRRSRCPGGRRLSPGRSQPGQDRGHHC